MNETKKETGILCGIPLWDKCMLLIMVILLLECGYLAIFQNSGNPQDASLEVVLRAAISSLFGYFLSANFLNNQRLNQQATFTDFQISRANQPPEAPLSFPNSPTYPANNDVPMPIAEHPPMEDISFLSPRDNEEEYMVRDCHWVMRIKIVTAICIFSIGMLIFIRNVPFTHTNTAPYVAMFANMTSGSLGYLIGYLPSQKNNL